MKTTLKTAPSRHSLTTLSGQSLLLCGMLIIAFTLHPSLANASILAKANNTSNLNTAAAWLGGVVPGVGDIAQWDSNAGTSTTNPLGGTIAWGGIRILNPGAPVQISTNTPNPILTNGVFGIDMSAATVNLTFSNTVFVAPNEMQVWNVANGQTLSFITNLISQTAPANNAFNSGAVQVDTSGTVQLINATASPLILNSQGNPWMTYGSNDWAALNGSGQIIAASYTPVTSVWVANVNPDDVQNTFTNGSSVDTTSAIRFNQPTNCTVTDSGSVTVTARGILVTANSGGGAINGANLRPSRGSTAGSAFDVFQNSPNVFTIGATIAVGSSSTPVNLVKNGPGPLILTANNGAGGITVNGGVTINGGSVQGTITGSFGLGFVNVNVGNLIANSGSTLNNTAINIASGATNTVLVAAANGQLICNAPLTLAAGTTTLQFQYGGNVPFGSTAPMLLNSGFNVNGAVNVVALNGIPAVGQYPLIKWTNSISSGTFANFTLIALPLRTQGYLSNNTANASIDLVVTNVDEPIIWNANSGVWDVNQTANWVDQTATTTTYQQSNSFGDSVLFNDSAPGPSVSVTLNTNVIPGSVTVSNVNNTYTISGGGNINGVGSLTKVGSGMLTLSTSNSFAGGINLNGGSAIFTNIINLGNGGINFNGGTLQYNGNTDDISARVVVFNSGGATINTAGQTVNYANPIGSGGAGGLTKTGAGTLTLSGVHTYHGNTIVKQGTLTLGTTNAFLTNSPVITVNSGAILDAATSGVNLLLNGLVSQTLTGVGQVNGVVTSPASTAISPAGAVLTGMLSINGGLTVNGGTLNVDIAASSNDVISVTGPLTLTSGLMQLNVIGNLPVGRYVIINYSGALTGSGGNITLNGFSQAGTAATLDSSVAGQVAVKVAISANDTLTWPGTSSSWDTASSDWLKGGLSWIYTNGDTVYINDSETGGSTTLSLQAALEPNLVIVSNTVVPTYTFNDGTGTGGGNLDGNSSLVKDGTGTLIVNVANTYTGTTTIKNGTLQIGSGAIGDIGKGNVTNNAALVFQEGDAATHYVAGAISGTGSLTINTANGTPVILTNNNTYTGLTTISNGTLVVGNGQAAGSLGSNTSVTNNGGLMLNKSGTYAFAYNITGSGLFGNSGPGTVTLGGTLTYQGDTSISNGIVKLTANNELPSTNTVPGSVGQLNLDGGVASAGTLDLGGFNLTVNALAGQQNNVNGIITNSSTSTTTTNLLTVLNTTNSVYNGVIMDHGATGAKTALLVTGPGTLTLNAETNLLTLAPGLSLFGGGITVSNSTLAFGLPNSSVLVNSDANALAPGTGPINLLGTNATLILNGYTGGTTPTYTPLTNTIVIPAGQVGTIDGPQRGAVASTILGGGVLNYQANYVRDEVSGNWSGFTGPVYLSGAVANVNIGFDLSNCLSGLSVNITTNVIMYFRTAGQIFQIGSLAGGDFMDDVIEGTTSGNAGGQNVSIAVGGNNASTTYSGGIIDPVSLIKVGTGKLSLNCGGIFATNIVLNGLFTVTNVGYGTNVVLYSGATTVSNGTLAIDAPVVLTNSPEVTLASASAVLDASSMGYVSNEFDSDGVTVTNSFLVTNSIFEVVISKSFNGYGTFKGILQSDAGSYINPGNPTVTVTNNVIDLANPLPTGVMNVMGTALIGGIVNMSLNITNGVMADELTATSFVISNTASLIVTNVGPNIVNGTTFTLFNHPVSFASVTLPATSPGGSTYVWQNNLASNGTITLTSGGASSTPPPITATFNGTTLALSWPQAYLGYTLQVQTNSLKTGIGTNWVNVPNSTLVTSTNITVNQQNGAVFYRLMQ